MTIYMINIELVIFVYIFTSFLLFYYYSETVNVEGACTSKPFFFNKKKPPNDTSFSKTSSPSGQTGAGTQDMISAFILTIEEIEAAMADIKKKIPVKFNLGIVNNTDGHPNMYIDGALPNVYLSFLMQNPPQGPKGITGDNANPYGPTGEIGPTGMAGLDGYWGTTKSTIF